MLLDTACGECAWLVIATRVPSWTGTAATINLVWDQRRREYDHFDAETGRWQQWLKLAPGLVVSAIFLALLLWNVDWDQFWSSLRGANYAWLMLSLLALTLAVILKVQRWQLLLLPAKRTSPTNVFYSISIGYLVNTVLPGRLGELARASLLARLESISVMTVLSTVAVDRILDLVVLALLLAIVLPMADLPDWVAKSGLLVGLGLGPAILLPVLAYPKGRDFFLRHEFVAPLPWQACCRNGRTQCASA